MKKAYDPSELEKYKSLPAEERLKIIGTISHLAQSEELLDLEELKALLEGTGHYTTALSCFIAYGLGDTSWFVDYPEQE